MQKYLISIARNLLPWISTSLLQLNLNGRVSQVLIGRSYVRLLSGALGIHFRNEKKATKSTVFQKHWNKWWILYLNSFTELSSTTMLSITTVSLPSGSFPLCARLKVFDTLSWPRFATIASRDLELTGMISRGAWIETFMLILELWICKLWI